MARNQTILRIKSNPIGAILAWACNTPIPTLNSFSVVVSGVATPTRATIEALLRHGRNEHRHSDLYPKPPLPRQPTPQAPICQRAEGDFLRSKARPVRLDTRSARPGPPGLASSGPPHSRSRSWRVAIFGSEGQRPRAFEGVAICSKDELPRRRTDFFLYRDNQLPRLFQRPGLRGNSNVYLPQMGKRPDRRVGSCFHKVFQCLSYPVLPSPHTLRMRD